MLGPDIVLRVPGAGAIDGGRITEIDVVSGAAGLGARDVAVLEG